MNSRIKNYGVLIHSNYRPSNSGGVEKVVDQLLPLLRSKFSEVLVFYGATTSSIFCVDGHTEVGVRILGKFRGLCFLSFGNIRFLLAAAGKEVIIFQEPYPYLWPSIKLIRLLRPNKRVIVLVHANPNLPSFFSSLYSRLRRFVFGGCHLVFTSRQVMNDCLLGDDEQHKLIIPLGLSSNRFMSVPVQGLPERFVLYLGRIASYKGIDVLLQAARLSPEVSFVIAGVGEKSDFVLDFITRHCLQNVVFINRFVSEGEKVALFEACDMFAFPSTSKNEAFGIIQLEAMSHGKPIVNTDLDSGVNFVAPDGVCAITVAPCDVAAFNAAIRLLWSDQKLRTELGLKGNERLEEMFSEDRFLRSWDNLLGSITK